MSKFTAKDPEVIACKSAGKKLYQSLQDAGVQLTGVGVGISADQKHPAIRINLLTKTKINIPAVFEGYEVHTTITGEIKAL